MISNEGVILGLGKNATRRVMTRSRGRSVQKRQWGLKMELNMMEVTYHAMTVSAHLLNTWRPKSKLTHVVWHQAKATQYVSIKKGLDMMGDML